MGRRHALLKSYVVEEDAMRSFKFRCPNPQCRLTLCIPVQTQGKRVRCAGCGRSFLAPPAGLADKKTSGEGGMSEITRKRPAA